MWREYIAKQCNKESLMSQSEKNSHNDVNQETQTATAPDSSANSGKRKWWQSLLLSLWQYLSQRCGF